MLLNIPQNYIFTNLFFNFNIQKKKKKKNLNIYIFQLFSNNIFYFKNHFKNKIFSFVNLEKYRNQLEFAVVTSTT